MLAGYPPFCDETPFGIYEKILKGKVDYPSHFDPLAKDLISKLLIPDKSRRIGCLKNGAEDIKRHKWFKDADWDAIYNRTITAPIIPSIRYDGDTQNYASYPEEPPGELVTGDPYRDLFPDF